MSSVVARCGAVISSREQSSLRCRDMAVHSYSSLSNHSSRNREQVRTTTSISKNNFARS